MPGATTVEDELQQRIDELEEERDALRASAARFERAGQIDRAAADGVQSEVKALQDERAELKREVALLKPWFPGVKRNAGSGRVQPDPAGRAQLSLRGNAVEAYG